MKRTYKKTGTYTGMFTHTDRLYKKYAKSFNTSRIAIYVARILVRTLLPETEYISRVKDYK